MTSPIPQPTDADTLSKLVAGNQNLITNPGLVQALAQHNATPQQAGAINQFLTGLQAQRAVQIASDAGTKISLSSDEQQALDTMGVSYGNVQLTAQDVINAEEAKIRANGGVPVVDSQGNVTVQAPQQKQQGGGGWFGGPGDFLHHLTHNAVTSALGQGWNTVDTAASQVVHTVGSEFSGVGSVPQGGTSQTLGVGGVTSTQAGINANKPIQQNAQAMTALGYDPTNPLSVIAFNSRGYSHSDTSDLAAKVDANGGMFGWQGTEAVTQAEQYLANPDKYMKQVESDPNLTPQEKDARLTDPAWGDLVKQVSGRQSNVGNDAAHSVGLDPVRDSTQFNLVSAGVDTTASFLLDPTMMLGGVAKAAKLTSIGLDGLGDTEKIAKIMDPLNRSVNAMRVRAGWTSLISDGNKIRTALDAGDEAGAASAYAHARAATPSIADLLPDIIGKQQLTGAVDASGKAVVAEGKPITNLAEMTEYLTSKNALMRLTRGKAVTESALMPGSLTPGAYNWLKGKVAGAVAGRSATINLARAQEAEKLIARPGADLVDELSGAPLGGGTTGDELNDVAANFDPDHLDQELEGLTGGGLASQNRATNQAAANGQALFNLRKYGQVDPETGGLAGWARPAAVAARMKLAGQRLSSFLPRNNLIDLGAPDAAEKVYRFGLQFLNKGDAALYGAKFVAGHEGDQKAVVDAIMQQTAHAAGLGTTDAGRELINKMSDRINNNAYGHIGNDTFFDLEHGGDRAWAIHPSQVREQYWLPSFKTLHTAAAKATLWQHTAGRAFNSTFADTFMDYERMAMLMKPNVAYRNVIEPFMNLGIRGRFTELLQAKKVLGDAADGVQTPRKQLLEKAFSSFGLDRAGRLYRNHIAPTVDPEVERYQREFTEGPFADEFHSAVLGVGDALPRESVDPLGVEMSDAVTRQGMRAQRFERTGYGMDSADGQIGAERFAHALATRYNEFPDLTRAIIENVQSGKPVDGIVDALQQPGMRRIVDKMKASRQYADENGVERRVKTEAERDMALRRIAQSMKADALYLFTGQNGEHIKPLADHIFEHGKAPNASWIQDNLKDDFRPKAVLAPQYRALAANGPLGMIRGLLDAAGVGYQKLVEDPIKRLSTEPIYLMNYGIQRKALAGIQDHIEQSLLEPKLEALTERHAFESAQHEMTKFKTPEEEQTALDNMTARHETERLDVHEQAATAAQRVAHDMAVKRAYGATEDLIDDPGLKTQADIVGRNFFMFTRAMQAFARRWGKLAIEDPTAYRKAFLTMEGLHHAGLTYGDSYGNVNFIYPGSDLTFRLMHDLGQKLHIPGLAQFPISGGLNGQLSMIAPGIDNPARLSMSPLLNIPYHAVEAMVPQHRTVLDEVDRALNGQDSQGKSWFTELVPGGVAKWTAAMNSDPRQSAMASAMRSAITNLAAVDPDGSKGIFLKPDATASDVDLFMTRLQQQVKNQLYLRAAFGEFAPAPPGIPSEDTSGSKPDAAFSALGIRNLSDEYKKILADTGGDRAMANAIFTANNPERAVYTIPTSQSTTNKAYLPATTTADQWLESNLGFIGKYDKVAAYFVPQDTGPFDLHAYRTQMELGMRQNRTPAEFYDQYRIITAEQQYYAQKAISDAQVNTDLQAGNKAAATKEKANFSAWTTSQFDVANPLFADKRAQWAEASRTAQDSLKTLTDMVSDPNVPANVARLQPSLNAMIQAWGTHEAFVAQHKGSQIQNAAARKMESAQFSDWMLNVAESDPNLASIYNGVFRVLDSGLTQATAQANSNSGG